MTQHSPKHLALALASWLVLLFLVHPTAPLWAQDADYFKEMPSAQQVADDFKGRSSRESTARAYVALGQLSGIIRSLSAARGPGQPLLPAETERLSEYHQLAEELIRRENAKVDLSCNGDHCDKYMLSRCSSAYSYSPASAREILDRYFSPQWQARHATRVKLGTVWQRGLKLPAGAKALDTLSPMDSTTCAGESAGVPLSSRVTQTVIPYLKNLWPVLAGLAFVVWLLRKIPRMRYFTLRKSNRAALEAFGADKATREHAILDAFDSLDHTFGYSGVNRNGGHKMSFTLLRSIKSFRRGDLEALRFAYLAFNRGLIDNEKFHWFRFSAIYAGGTTDPSDWKFKGMFSWLRSSKNSIDQARASVANFAQGNAGADIESQALAAIQKLVIDHPSDSLYRDMQRRFVDGIYWLTQGEVKRSAFAPSDSPYNLSFGLLDGTDTELIFAGDGSVMTVAPPGSGKTQCNVFPNMLRWPGPALVLDVKGEIYDHTASWRAANVGPVIKFSPLDPANSACFNPLTFIRNEALYIWEDARFLASMMIVPAAKEPFWEDKARDILTAIIADVAFWNPPEDRAMSKVLSLVNRNGWSEFVERLRKNPESATMRDEGSNFAHMEAKTLDGALQTAKASLSAWVGDRIGHITGKSDWNPLDLRDGKNLTIYVCVKPNEIDAYLSLLRVVIAQHIRALTSTKIPPRGTAPILFVLDELPRLKHMPPVEEALEVGRGYGIKLWMFTQSIGQMRSAYPNADGMMGSCAVRTFMNPSLQDGTAKMLAEQIGHKKGEEHGGKDKVASTHQELVVDPSQLAGADFKDLQIVMGVGSKPAKVRKQFAYANPALVEKMNHGQSL